MKTKPLYILINDCGDGSYHPVFILDPELITKIETAYDEGKIDYESGIGIDGDGFHYKTVQVPEDSTAESLGVSLMTEYELDD